MTTFKFKFDPINAKKMNAELKSRLEKISAVAGRKMAEKTKEEVLNSIPNRGGWLKIYRDALEAYESKDGKSWSVAGVADIELTQIPAENSMVTFNGGDEASAILERYNPWTIDAIPAISGGINTTLNVMPASDSEVSARRSQLKVLLTQVLAELKEEGITVQKDERPIINGDVKADLAFLSKRLEYGLGGFEKVKHWGPASRKLESKGENWLREADTINQIEKVASGQDINSNIKKMNDSLEKELEQVRKISWK